MVIWSLTSKSLFLNFRLCSWNIGMGRSIPTPFFFPSVGIFPNDFWVTSRGIVWESRLNRTVSNISVQACAVGPLCVPHITETREDVTHLWHHSQRGGLCEVWAGGVFYISLCHGVSFPDKHKNVWRNLECNWNIEEKLTSTEELAEGLRGIKSSGKLPVVNKFYIIQTALLFVFFWLYK